MKTMNMEELFENLGGLRNFKEKDGRLKNNDIKELERILQKKIPNDYMDYLTEFGVKLFNELVFFKSIEENAIYNHPKEDHLPNLTFSGSYIDGLYGKLEESTLDLFYNIKTYKNRIPAHCLPIGSESSGGLILINLNEEQYSQIYFWDHDNEWDKEDYEKETNKKFTEKIKYQNCYLLANTFSDFLRSLEVEE